MRIPTILASLLIGLVLATSPLSAQRPQPTETSGGGIKVIADATLGADIDTMIFNLEEPIADADLPERFSSAEYVDPARVTSEDLVLPIEDVGFAEGSVGFNVDYRPQSRGLAFEAASLNYLVLDGEITDDNLDDFKAGLGEGSEEGGSAVEDIDVNGVRGVHLTITIEEGDVASYVEMIAVPVGDTLVLSMVVVASDDPSFRSSTVRADTMNLLLSGIGHLGTSADSAQ